MKLNRWKIHLIVPFISLLLAHVQADYTIMASNEEGSYHYPAPPQSQRLQDPIIAHKTVNAAPQNQHQGYYYSPAFTQQTSAITKQFFSPALDNAAFNLALNNQGYTFGNTAFNAAFKIGTRSSKTTLRAPASPNPTPTSSTPVLGSRNVKLPLPIGVTPLNIAPLPLQPGTAYANIPNTVTSYGTVYPQRKRR